MYEILSEKKTTLLHCELSQVLDHDTVACENRVDKRKPPKVIFVHGVQVRAMTH